MPHTDKEAKKTPTGVTQVDATLFSAGKDEKKPNPIFDIPQIKFNTDKHKKALSNTSVIYEAKEYDTHLELEKLYAPDNKPGSGIGTAIFRDMVQRTIDLEYPGKLIAHVSTSKGSPHLFYLYMGMVPETYQARYLDHTYGDEGYEVRKQLVTLSQHTEWNPELLKNVCDEDTLESIKSVLRYELGIADRDEIISLDDIVNHREFLLQLKDKKLDFLLDIFIPELLKILAANPTEKYPNTKDLGIQNMLLTEQGFARWKFVLDNELEFVPFRNLEHINLRPEQQALLKKIVEQRTAKSAQP